jgi:hypothetical protein
MPSHQSDYATRNDDDERTEDRGYWTKEGEKEVKDKGGRQADRGRREVDRDAKAKSSELTSRRVRQRAKRK